MDGDKPGESGDFLFSRRVPDSHALVGDHSRQMKTQICTGGTSAMDFAHYQSPKLLVSSPQIKNKYDVSARIHKWSHVQLSQIFCRRRKNRKWSLCGHKEFHLLYNRASADFKDRSIKNNAWRKISKLLDLEESKCKQRYESIRTTFSCYVRKALGKSGAGRDDIQLDPKYEHLRWLAAFIKTRSTSGNVHVVHQVNEDQINSDNWKSEEEDKFPSEETSSSK